MADYATARGGARALAGAPPPRAQDIADMMGLLRYGVPTSEKERLARSAELPGSPRADSEEAEEADRYAAGYLFGQQWPTASRVLQPYVDMVKTSDLPLIGGADPELQSWASHGVQQGQQAAGPRVPAGSAAEALVASMGAGRVGQNWRR